jgi:hypothetical protein
MRLKICETCKLFPGCKKSGGRGDFCQTDWAPFGIEIHPAGENRQRHHQDIPFEFVGYSRGYVRLMGPMPGIPPTIVVSSDRQVEVEVILQAKE